MEYRRLGTTDCFISRLGFGCAPASGYDYGPVDESSWIDAVRAALDCGINFFDVAEVYGFGYAEELLTRALDQKRHEVVIATKGGLVRDGSDRVHRDASRYRIAQSVEDSLRRLRVDVIPLSQIHWPDPATPIVETLDALATCQQQGKIRFIGVCNFALGQLQGACESHRVESIQVPYNPLCREIEHEILPWCESTKTGVVAHTGLARGLLAGKRQLGSRFEAPDTRNGSPYFSEDGLTEKKQLVEALRQLSERTRRSISSVALRWILDNPRVTAVLVGIKNPAQLEENLKAVDWQLDNSDYELLSNLSAACPRGLTGVPAHGAAGG